ncbi:MAG: hypothetical protein V2J26_05085 [Pacificimonas sp.]|jgi:hypothetical protein|nr:hypothetical protein [Pacificimonas sp.]
MAGRYHKPASTQCGRPVPGIAALIPVIPAKAGIHLLESDTKPNQHEVDPGLRRDDECACEQKNPAKS